MEGVIQKLANRHHVDHGSGSTCFRQIDHVEVIDVVALGVVDEEVVDGVLIRRSRAHQPERIGPRHVFHWGLVIGQAQGDSWEWSALHDTPFWSSRDHQIEI